MTDSHTWMPQINCCLRRGGGCAAIMAPSKGGMWVSLSYYQALEAEVARLTAVLAKQGSKP